MNRTFTINLNGIVFNIDDDAYNLLDNYLNTLSDIFCKEGNQKEIISDIEARIAEILIEKNNTSSFIISKADVEDIIERMGHPDQFKEFEPEQGDSDNEPTATCNETGQKRKLFRNCQDKMLGGVCSGISSYLNVDVTWVRLICIGLTLLTATFIIVGYIVLWIVVPEAKSAADKLAMHGETPTMENIGKTVKDSYEQVENYARPYINKMKNKGGTKRFTDKLFSVLSWIFKIALLVVAIALIPVVVGLFIGVIGALIGLIVFAIGESAWLIGITPFVEWGSSARSIMGLIGVIGILLSIGIPLISFIYFIFKNIMHTKPMSDITRNILLILWIIGVVVAVVSVSLVKDVLI